MTELTEEQKAKAVGQLRLGLTNILQPFMKYGFQEKHELPYAIDVIIELAIDFGKRYRGIDVPIHPERARAKAGKRKANK